jgi:small subunit ribosomal protein S4
MARSHKGVTGEQLLQLLERRLDNIVYRLGFSPSRNGARQLITHGHITVNSRKVNVPSFLVNAGDTIEVKEKSKKLNAINSSLENREQRGWTEWLEMDKDAKKGKVKALPERKDMSTTIQETLIIEYYSK